MKIWVWSEKNTHTHTTNTQISSKQSNQLWILQKQLRKSAEVSEKDMDMLTSTSHKELPKYDRENGKTERNSCATLTLSHHTGVFVSLPKWHLSASKGCKRI